MLKKLQKLAGFLNILKYPVIILAIVGFILTLLALFQPQLVNGNELLFFYMVLMVWSLLIRFFSIAFCDLPDFSQPANGIFAKIKQFFHKMFYYIIALLVIGLSLALISLTQKMLVVTFL